MIKSMTAFGRGRGEFAAYTLTVDIRSVNSRYFDCTVRLPRAYTYLEERVRSYVQESVISRGKVEVSVNYDFKSSEAGTVTANLPFARDYLAALCQLRDELGLTDDISVMTLARNPEVFTYVKQDESPDDAWQNLLACLTLAGEDFSAMREREGAKIEADIRGKLAAVSRWADEVEQISLSDTVGYRDRLEARLRAILGETGVAVDEGRLLTECAVWADKIAIDEELVRLRAHFGAFRDICAEKTPSGKKLDFLMQELNRETNTVGSKANNAAIARLVVNMKNELEKIREQVQNVE